MKKRILSISLALGVWSAAAQAQQLRIAYFGETITHYGLKIGYEHPLRTRVKPNSTVRHEWLLVPSLAAYRHPHNHVGLIASPELAYRRTGRRGGLVELSVSPSYFRYVLDGRTYELSDDGTFRRVPLAGRSAFLPTVSLGIGRDLSVRRQVPISWYARVNLMQQRPYNASQLLRFGVEAGVIRPLRKRS